MCACCGRLIASVSAPTSQLLVLSRRLRCCGSHVCSSQQLKNRVAQCGSLDACSCLVHAAFVVAVAIGSAASITVEFDGVWWSLGFGACCVSAGEDCHVALDV